jgi:peptidoglycan/xylan/chitin deacetylase (PgdA/CDA1 family)
MRSYYRIKPLLPRRLQLALRRAYARKQALRKFPAWPIEPLLVDHQHDQLRRRVQASGGGAVPLVNFWPDGRRFAAILTHDVESSAGIERIGELLDVERRHGMVSSWNFVAEDYPIPEGTFGHIRGAGGEVGLHGIHHDGRLFSDRGSFEAQLDKIHRYLAAWDAVGFRSPSTHRNAEWMPDLGCLYDSSFPDTDPFEPQPGGCCSIFPYFLGDLTELPITVPQDHTLWEVLRQRSIDLWREKGDWIVAHHGLINVIVHPDYVTTAERLALYDQLLGYLRDRLDAEPGWHALPREVAAWWKARAGMRISDGKRGARVVGEGDRGAHLDRATVAWACELNGALVIDSLDRERDEILAARTAQPGEIGAPSDRSATERPFWDSASRVPDTDTERSPP